MVATTDRGRDPRARRRLRAVHAARVRRRRRRRAARGGHERRHHARRDVRRRAPAGRATTGRGCSTRASGAGSSIYATGSSPGFITDALPFALLSLQRRVESIEIDEFAEPVAARLAAHAVPSRWASASRSPSSTRTAPRTCSPSSAFARRARRGRGPADRRLDRAAARSRPRAHDDAAGRGRDRGRARSGAQRTTIIGYAAPVRRSCGSRPTGTARPTSSRPGISARRAGGCGCAATRRSTSTSRSRSRSTSSVSFTPAFTANRPVNAIPYVCAAPPGILSTTDLPPITPAGP